MLVRALQLPEEAIAACHRSAKNDLIELVKTSTGATLRPAGPDPRFRPQNDRYKRPLLIFENLDRLMAIASRHPLQLVMAGKAHPRDEPGKEAIRWIAA